MIGSERGYKHLAPNGAKTLAHISYQAGVPKNGYHNKTTHE